MQATMQHLWKSGHTVVSPASLRLYFAILAFFQEHGYAPTYRQMLAAVGDTGLNGLPRKLSRLVAAGLLVREADPGGGSARSFVPVRVKLIPPSALGPTTGAPPTHPESLP